jgi:uncharacterized protein
MPELMIDTPRGPARAHLSLPEIPAAAVALIVGHGAGGGVGAPDVQAARRAALSLGFTVALVEQPYRVAGRRAPAPATHLDEAWSAVVARLRQSELAGMAIVTGGRSLGARVACRTATVTGSAGVLCLAFPLLPPQRAAATKPALSRLPELEGVAVPTLVIQGLRDRFGMPPEGPQRTVVPIPGDHGLKADLPAVEQAVSGWLAALPELVRVNSAPKLLNHANSARKRSNVGGKLPPTR